MPASPGPNSIARNFRKDLLSALRKASGIQQKAIASTLKVTGATVSRWESGKDKPTNSHLDSLAIMFDVPKDYFSDPTEHTQIPLSVYSGNVATYILSLPMVQTAEHSIVVFQTGRPKAPNWWREQLKKRLIDLRGAVEYLVIACIPPSEASSELMQ